MMRWLSPFIGIVAAVALGVIGAPAASAENCTGPLTARVCVKPGNAELHSTPDPQFRPPLQQASPWAVIGGTGSGVWIP